MKKYTTAFPYFEEHHIDNILSQFRDILEGKELLSMGKNVAEFEKKFAAYCGCQFGIAVNSCSMALEIAIKSLNLPVGSEIIVPAQTFIATGLSVIRNGYNLVFCDTDNNFLLSFENLKKKITERTKVVIIVHFAGLISEDIFKISEYLKEHGIALIEDCAHAHGAYICCKNKKYIAGSIGDLGCYSFFSTKIMTTGEGGMIVTNNVKLSEAASSLRNRGLDYSKPGENFILPGTNSRFTEVQAIMGLAQLESLDFFVRHRNRIAQIYKEKLSQYVRFQEYSNGRHAYWRFLVFLLKDNQRNDVMEHLKQMGISCDAPYFPLLHQQPIFNCKEELPIVESLSKTHISLPIHLKITEEDANFIAERLLEVLR